MDALDDGLQCPTDAQGRTRDPEREETLRRRVIAFLGTSRRANGLSQSELARRLGKPQSYVSKIERGERSIDVAEYIEFVRAMGLNPVTPLMILLDPDTDPDEADNLGLYLPGAVAIED